MSWQVLVGAVTAFAAVGLLVYVVADWVAERRAAHRTLRGATAGDGRSDLDVRGQMLAVPALERLGAPAMATFTRLGRRFSPVGTYDRVAEELVYAGNPRGWDTERVLAFKIIMPVVAGGGAFLLTLAMDITGAMTLLAVVLFAAAGWYSPEWVVRSKASTRQHQMQLDLPDTLDLLSITVQAGLGFDAALNRVSKQIRGPLGEELLRIVQEVQLGKARAEALRDLADRTTVEDLKSFIAAMVQAEAFGVPIVRVLQVQAREIRLRRRQRAEETAQKLPVKIVFPVVLTIFPSIFVVLLGPAAIDIYENLLSL